MTLHDPHGRRINYLRLSVTDRCNLRCRYCMPAEGLIKVGHDDILSYEELLRIARAAVAIGVEKIRVTGGEPLVRRGIIDFLHRLAAVPGLQRLVLTTNGMLLREMAADLRSAGVESLNISLDSLRPQTFAEITRGGELRRALNGIAAAEAAGFEFIKINVVVMRGVNDDELEDFAALTLASPYRVRFIEYMPTLAQPGWEATVMPGAEILDRLAKRFPMADEAPEKMAGPARYRRIAGAAGLVGVITPVSCHFCGECNRIRVTSRGIAKSCLFDRGTVDLRPILANGDDAALREALRRTVAEKPDRHQLAENNGAQGQIDMARIGG
ncbi:cyclic pyranopterin monophosphate synthase [Geobacter sp. OR-1]|uniref:GTP 3',8-cyclase MoaA n=1 Tax=Geobacter sp. OR-1 TaxID=1266765 RepID=UPI0005424E0B|nr:GTP 3',8-cyclase MoaA [Geobacter sp. OR-1]GAM09119.1 cyclic pyranopterin monophosphate synthase [Geobacter sp. OR-1]